MSEKGDAINILSLSGLEDSTSDLIQVIPHQSPENIVYVKGHWFYLTFLLFYVIKPIEINKESQIYINLNKLYIN